MPRVSYHERFLWINTIQSTHPDGLGYVGHGVRIVGEPRCEPGSRHRSRVGATRERRAWACEGGLRRSVRTGLELEDDLVAYNCSSRLGSEDECCLPGNIDTDVDYDLTAGTSHRDGCRWRWEGCRIRSRGCTRWRRCSRSSYYRWCRCASWSRGGRRSAALGVGQELVHLGLAARVDSKDHALLAMVALGAVEPARYAGPQISRQAK